MPGLRRGLAGWLVDHVVRPGLSPSIALGKRRRRNEAVARLLPPARGVRIESAHLGGLPGEWLLPRDARPDVAGLYVHGGGFMMCSPRTHRALAAGLARAAGMDLFVLDYRLAPECPFPAARDDVLGAWRDLMTRSHLACGVMAGDSAGGTLAVSATVALAAAGESSPAALALFSPLLDLTLPALGGEDAPPDRMLPAGFVREGVDAYRGHRPAGDPRISPLHADLDGLPPTFVAADGQELLAGDARRLAARCPGAVTLLEGQGLWHAWPLFAGLLP
jgi:monoterpene epsilon-lactone hydrolase